MTLWSGFTARRSRQRFTQRHRAVRPVAQARDAREKRRYSSRNASIGSRRDAFRAGP
jgi:hypothetical protein